MYLGFLSGNGLRQGLRMLPSLTYVGLFFKKVSVHHSSGIFYALWVFLASDPDQKLYGESSSTVYEIKIRSFHALMNRGSAQARLNVCYIYLHTQIL